MITQRARDAYPQGIRHEAEALEAPFPSSLANCAVFKVRQRVRPWRTSTAGLSKLNSMCPMQRVALHQLVQARSTC